MRKVTIEITEKGYKREYINGDLSVTEVWERTPMGAQVVSERDFDSLTDDEVSDDMWDALNYGDSYDIMKALGGE